MEIRELFEYIKSKGQVTILELSRNVNIEYPIAYGVLEFLTLLGIMEKIYDKRNLKLYRLKDYKKLMALLSLFTKERGDANEI